MARRSLGRTRSPLPTPRPGSPAGAGWAALTRRGVGAVLVLAAAGRQPAGVAGAADQAPLTGMLVTAAATAEDVTPDAPEASGGLLVGITLHNRTGGDAAGVRLRLPVPAGTRVDAPAGGAASPVVTADGGPRPSPGPGSGSARASPPGPSPAGSSRPPEKTAAPSSAGRPGRPR